MLKSIFDQARTFGVRFINTIYKFGLALFIVVNQNEHA